MSTPGIRDGYIQAGYEWLASVLSSGFKRLEQVVLNEVFQQVYGMARLPHATLCQADIARRVGKSATHVGRDIRGLVKQGVLESLGGHRYRPVEDYTKWALDGEKPDARQARIDYCRDASRQAKSFRRADSKAVDASDAMSQQPLPFLDAESPPSRTSDQTKSGLETGPQPDQIWSDDQTKSGLTTRPNLVSQPDQIWSDDQTKSGLTKAVPPGPPIGERARGIENSREKLRRGGEADPPTRLGIFDSEKTPAEEDPEVARRRSAFAAYRQSLAKETGGD